MFSLDQELTLESYHYHLLVVFLTEITFWTKWEFFSEIRIIAGSVETKSEFPDNLGHNILEHCFNTDPINHK